MTQREQLLKELYSSFQIIENTNILTPANHKIFISPIPIKVNTILTLIDSENKKALAAQTKRAEDAEKQHAETRKQLIEAQLNLKKE
jgi:hypothetical protein